MIKAVLFDLDGTLVNSLFDLATSTNYALEQMGFKTHTNNEYCYFVGNGMKKLIERALPSDKTDEETFNKCFDIFYSHYKEHFYDKTIAYEGIEDLLIKLNQKEIMVSVISNKQHEMAVTVVEKILPKIKFHTVSGKQENYPAKPDNQLTLKIIANMGVEPAECLFVGDSNVDMQTALNSGIKSVGVLWGFRTKDELLNSGANYIASKASEIYDIIEAENEL